MYNIISTMRNKYFKKWKKTHRQRRKKREIVIKLEISPEVIYNLVNYCKLHKCSFNTAIKRAIRRAIIKQGWYNESK